MFRPKPSHGAAIVVQLGQICPAPDPADLVVLIGGACMVLLVLQCWPCTDFVRSGAGSFTFEFGSDGLDSGHGCFLRWTYQVWAGGPGGLLRLGPGGPEERFGPPF